MFYETHGGKKLLSKENEWGASFLQSVSIEEKNHVSGKESKCPNVEDNPEEAHKVRTLSANSVDGREKKGVSYSAWFNEVQYWQF